MANNKWLKKYLVDSGDFFVAASPQPAQRARRARARGACARPMSGICFQYRDTGSCRFGSTCRFDHNCPRRRARETNDGRRRPEKRRPQRRRSRSRSRDPQRDGRSSIRRRSCRSSPSPDSRSRSPDYFGRNIPRDARSIEREEARRAELRRAAARRKLEEKRRDQQKRREMERKSRLDFQLLTSSAHWDEPTPRPPGTDLRNYVSDKHQGLVCKNNCWVYDPGPPPVWYQKRTGRYFRYDKSSHSYVVLSDGAGQDGVESAGAASALGQQQQQRQQQQKQQISDASQEMAPTNTAAKKSPGSPRQWCHAVESWTGRKDSLEDRVVCAEPIVDIGHMFAVLDGHGGATCAEFVARKLGKQISTAYRRVASSVVGTKQPPNAETETVSAAMFEGFRSVDTEYLRLAKKKKKQAGTTDEGSTAVCALLVGCLDDDMAPARLYVANLGDSRAILCRGGRAVRLTSDHKPNVHYERKRIEKNGGCVMQIGGIWRVARQGWNNAMTGSVCLSTSRSFGDLSLKIPSVLVSAEPELRAVCLAPEDLFFVLVCDGITDVMSDQDIVDIACDNLSNPEVRRANYYFLFFIFSAPPRITSELLAVSDGPGRLPYSSSGSSEGCTVVR